MSIEGILIDLDGVVYESGKAIPGAIAVVTQLQAQNFPHLFVTNTTSKPRRAIVEKLADMGVEVAEESILTPVVAALNWIKANAAEPVALHVPDATRADFAGIREADDTNPARCVVMGDLGEQWDFARLNRIFRQLKNSENVKLLALGMTRYWRAEDGLRLDVGPFVKAMEFASDCEALVMGKPVDMFFSQAAEILHLSKKKLAMIGDDVQSDVIAAQQAGMQGILVKTGKFTEGDLQKAIEPNHVLGSIADLPEFLHRH